MAPRAPGIVRQTEWGATIIRARQKTAGVIARGRAAGNGPEPAQRKVRGSKQFGPAGLPLRRDVESRRQPKFAMALLAKLEHAVDACIQQNNPNPRPFVWRKKGRNCKAIPETLDWEAPSPVL
ncbi:MAG: hypothetical protein DLM68_04425 [Hyphomicrobiales bacterium]|nr:MAG: hypothetical protein DLM68_04425 [Hyphomicrobiales bacterium]